MHYYSIYNLTIASEIQIRSLTELAVAPSMYDVEVSVGTPPQALSREPLVKNVCTEMCENEFMFFHETLGVRFYVRNGSEVVVDHRYCSDLDLVSIFFLGSVMGAVLYMRNIIPMHASTVITDKGAVLFTGISGVGKSTLAFALMRRGYRLLGDDVAPIRLIKNHALVSSSYPQLKLWQDSLKMNQVIKNTYPQIRDSFKKYYVDFRNALDGRTYPVVKIFHLNSHSGNDLLTIEKNKEIDRLKIIRQNTYRKAYIRGLKKEEAHFHMSIRLAGLPMLTVTRPQQSDNFNGFVDSIEEAMLQ